MSFFFFKQKTAYELRISDWSSDVCSSDLDEGSDWFAPSNLEVTDLSVGNTATNVIPGEARARLNIRFNDLHTGAARVEWIRTTASPIAPSAVLKAKISRAAFFTPPDRFSTKLTQAAERDSGLKPPLARRGGTWDARFTRRLSSEAHASD